jgi:hypothetical protein
VKANRIDLRDVSSVSQETGSSKPSTRRLLERIAESASSRQPLRAVPVQKTPRGTVLIRDWQGVSHRVIVVDDAVVYREQRYRSLSEVARVITGARWSGPLFFGLKRMLRSVALERAKLAVRRCAVYIRKSSEEGLDQDFNSLNAQREACEAFIKSQAGEGWRLVKTAYDDGGLSGGTIERPALQATARRHCFWAHRCCRGLQGRPADPLAVGLRQDGRSV